MYTGKRIGNPLKKAKHIQDLELSLVLVFDLPSIEIK